MYINILLILNIQILLELDRIFFDNKWAIDCRIHETQMREYQVLPLRTHPMMNSKGYSGYVFTAVKIVDPEENLQSYNTIQNNLFLFKKNFCYNLRNYI